MMAETRQAIADVIETAVAANDPSVVAEAAKEISKLIAKDPKAGERTRKGTPPPTKSAYTFKQGQQVFLNSDTNGLRDHYEYVERMERFDKVMNLKTGKVVRVWLDKVLPVSVGNKMVAEQKKAAAAAEKQKKNA